MPYVENQHDESNELPDSRDRKGHFWVFASPMLDCRRRVARGAFRPGYMFRKSWKTTAGGGSGRCGHGRRGYAKPTGCRRRPVNWRPAVAGADAVEAVQDALGSATELAAGDIPTRDIMARAEEAGFA